MPLGIDIVKISRMEKLTGDKIPGRIFSKQEAEYILSKKNRAQTAAGIFAAKEAVFKALGCGITLPLPEAQILHTPEGKPYLLPTGKVLDFMEKAGICTPDISIAHDGEYAVAVAGGEGASNADFRRYIAGKLQNPPPNAITGCIVRDLLPKRSADSHKGTYGRLYVLAGSIGLTGAAIMTCTSALRCGAGLISLGCAQELNTIFEIAMQEVMTKPLKSDNGLITDENSDTIIKEIKNADICLIGPGLGRNDGITRIMKAVLGEIADTPLVIDADGLNAISEDMTLLANHRMPLILTPHIGEFARLTGLSSEEILSAPEKHAREFAEKYNVILVLKSHRTLVATPRGDIYVNLLGNPGMATGGSGDVLSGAIASFAAQGRTPEEAALAGVYIHSLAADIAVCKTGEYSLTPSDIIGHIPDAIIYTQQ